MAKRENKNPSVAATTKGQKSVMQGSKTNTNDRTENNNNCKNIGDWDGEPVHVFTKSQNMVAVRPRCYRGSEFIDIREYRKSDLTKPTGKGITIPYSEVVNLGIALSILKLSSQ